MYEVNVKATEIQCRNKLSIKLLSVAHRQSLHKALGNCVLGKILMLLQ